jgi:hypothetical protein
MSLRAAHGPSRLWAAALWLPLLSGCWQEACHAAAPQITSQGGPVLAHPKLVPIFFSNDTSPAPVQLQAFLQKLAASPYWHEVTAEYGVGPLTVTEPATLVAPDKIDDSDFPDFFAGAIDGGMLPAPDPDTVYGLFFPASTTVTLLLRSETICWSGPPAYHAATFGDSPSVPYVVVPRCGAPGAPTNEITGFQVASAVHELVEASTDPFQIRNNAGYDGFDDQHEYWDNWPGNELADACFGFSTTPADLGYSVPRIWSNRSAAEGHDPCVPAPSDQAYFNAAPDLPDQANDGLAVNISRGKSRTIPLRLFSDRDTPAWDVEVHDFNALFGGLATMDFALSQPNGRNGDSINLTITPHADAPPGERYFIVTSVDSALVRHSWVGAVVVE